MDTESQSLFDVVVEMTGLATVLGDGVVRHVLGETGCDPALATRQDYLGVLDVLEARMAVYMPPLEAKTRRHRLEQALSSDAPVEPRHGVE